MTAMPEYVHLQQRLHEMRDQVVQKIARQRASGAKPKRAGAARLQPQLARLEAALSRIEAGLHPVCVGCGERIEMDRLQADPAEALCWSCARPNRQRGAATRPAARGASASRP